MPRPRKNQVTIRTTDGYTFYVVGERVVDNLDPNGVDMSWESLDEFLRSQEGSEFTISGNGYRYEVRGA